jgi:general secretion pathway protein G
MKQSLAVRRRLDGQSGFTLIEILVVVAILAILAGVVVLAVSGVQDDGQQSACELDLRTVKTAAEAYRAENGSYATSEGALVSGGFLDAESTNYNYSSTAAGPPSYTAVAPCT